MEYEILVVDDEADIRMLVAGVLKDEGYQTRAVASGEVALSAIRSRLPSLVVLDIWLQGSKIDGLEVLNEIMREAPLLPVIMISGHGTIETAISAIRLGAYDFIEKPFKADRLLLSVERAIEAARLKRENQELRLRAGTETELIGSSAALAFVRQQIDKVAPTGSRVMITGPAGVGKEVVARLIHMQSKRSERPFVIANCAAVHQDRLEEELFGSDANGEAGRRVGLFEQANGGTLFLDEVTDIPLVTQGRLVRFLQDQTIDRLDGREKIQIDVRIIASSRQNLTTEIALGNLREDIYYRLSVVPIKLHPLRERQEDIPVLMEYFLQRASDYSGVPLRVVGDDAMVALQSYDWPGNVRQLRNVVDWLLIMAPGKPGTTISADMLPPEIRAVTPEILRWDKGGEIMSLSLREARETFEREYLLAQINRFAGNISRTANFVGMERSALHRKLKLLGVNNERSHNNMDAVRECVRESEPLNYIVEKAK